MKKFWQAGGLIPFLFLPPLSHSLENECFRSVPRHPLLCTIRSALSEKLQQRQASLSSLLALPEVLAFLPPQSRQSVQSMLSGKQEHDHVIADTGPGLVTRAVLQYLQRGSLPQLRSSKVLLLSCASLNPVPNLATVSLTEEDIVHNRDPVAETTAVDWSVLCELGGCAGNYFAQPVPVSSWQSYRELKQQFVGSHLGDSSSALAIHWWQRSWQ